MRHLVPALLAGLAFPATAQEFSVTGVAPGDTLNIRADIMAHDSYADAPLIGVIAPDAQGVRGTGRSVMLNGSTWREVRSGGVTGWVNDAFLWIEAPFPNEAAFSCFGTEPFWSLSFDAETGEARQMDRPAPTDLTVTDWRAAAGRRDVRRYRLDPGAESPIIEAIVAHTGQCSDGMSDFSHAYAVYVLGWAPDDLYAGCCTLK
ncbi:hypothetical protein [Anianabacter salinae]|uniref:hypothetical protein n=1 Tax=Anianabacter salinae TaxID=2851023 RepID=UPI00225E5ED6|nr:hypothetical protein [Anianabacter salinae]MBV0910926.1 hypothetical protein [Anianabacter salinae]